MMNTDPNSADKAVEEKTAEKPPQRSTESKTSDDLVALLGLMAVDDDVEEDQEEDDGTSDAISRDFLDDELDRMLDEQFLAIEDELQRQLDEQIQQSLQQELDQQWEEYYQKQQQDFDTRYNLLEDEFYGIEDIAWSPGVANIVEEGVSHVATSPTVKEINANIQKVIDEYRATQENAKQL